MNEKRNYTISRTAALPVIFISVFFHFVLGSLEFHIINQSKSYSEAKTHCRQSYTDLATIENLEDTNTLIDLLSTTVDTAWIGLEFGNKFNWHWSRADENTNYFNWGTEVTQTLNSEKCAAMSQNGTWLVSDCGDKQSFVCHANSDASSHKLIAEAKSWRDAQSHCRSLSSDLVSIHSAEENTAVSLLSGSQTVWIGLFGDPWIWSSRRTSAFRFWKPNQPNYVNGQQCVVTELKEWGKWSNRNCNTKFSFICHKELNSTPASTRPQATQSQSTSQQLPTNLTTPQQNSSQLATEGFYFERSTTGHLNITNVTASAPPNSVTASPTGMGTVAQSTIQSNTVTSQMNNSFVFSENLILIKKNLTWIEALTYCQKHHVDLVLINSKDTQDKVAAKAKNATSQYVWLGLRYSCNFKFWFWIGTTPSCYQNWMPGQGPEMVYECGTSGAVEATGRQQWTGLAETEEMNFICSENDG